MSEKVSADLAAAQKALAIVREPREWGFEPKGYDLLPPWHPKARLRLTPRATS